MDLMRILQLHCSLAFRKGMAVTVKVVNPRLDVVQADRIKVWTQAQAIVKTLYCLPLAIDQAAAYISLRPQMLLQTYLVRYETMAKDLLGNNEHKYPSYELTCMTTWEISRVAIREKSRAAAGLLQVCAFF